MRQRKLQQSKYYALIWINFFLRPGHGKGRSMPPDRLPLPVPPPDGPAACCCLIARHRIFSRYQSHARPAHAAAGFFVRITQMEEHMAGPVHLAGAARPRRGPRGFESRRSPHRGPDRLTAFERKVCHAVDQGLSDLQAYRAVRPLSTARDNTARRNIWEIRNRPHCIAYLAGLRADSLARHKDAKARLIAELAAAAFANLGDFLIDGPDGRLAVRPVADLSAAQLRGLRAVTITHSAHGHSVRLALHDKMAAIGKLTRLLGLEVRDRTRDATADAPAPMSPVERAQRLAALLRLAQESEEKDGPEDGAADEAKGVDGTNIAKKQTASSSTPTSILPPLEGGELKS